MSVSFYCYVWCFSHNPENLAKITPNELIELAIEPRSPDEYEKEPWLLEARRERAGKIVEKYDNMLKLSAIGSNGHCLYVKKLASLHKDVLFIAISGADCTDEETAHIFENGREIHSCRDVFKYERFPAALKVHHHYLKDKELCAKIKKEYYDLVSLVMYEDLQDAILQDDPEEQ